jgi:cytochrome P450
LLNHPDHIESVLAANPRDFHKGRALRAARSLLGNGLLTSEGEDWRRQRRSAQPAFHRERLAAFSLVIVDCAQRMLSRWRNGETRDIDRDLARLTLNITTQTHFNTDLDDQTGEMGAAGHHRIPHDSRAPGQRPRHGRPPLGAAGRPGEDGSQMSDQ